jgi:hypothetical protein
VGIDLDREPKSWRMSVIIWHSRAGAVADSPDLHSASAMGHTRVNLNQTQLRAGAPEHLVCFNLGLQLLSAHEILLDEQS